jgi:hypothetical protein
MNHSKEFLMSYRNDCDIYTSHLLELGDLEDYFAYLDSLGPRVWFFMMPYSNVS